MRVSHDAKIGLLQKQLEQSFKEKRPVFFKRSSTNSTRARKVFEDSKAIELTNLNEIIEVNVPKRYIDVEPAVSMDMLVSETLKLNLVPPVMPEFRSITVGGAVQGGALESSSYKYGQMNDTVLEYELLLADGTKVIATAANEYSDLFFGLATSYGSIALITRVRLPLIPASKYVCITVQPYPSSASCCDALFEKTQKAKVDFVEGLLFSETHAAMITGVMTDKVESKIRTFSRNIDSWYYRFLRELELEKGATFTVPIEDYLFRYDRGAFWMGEYLFPIFKLTSNPLTRFLFAPFLHARKLYDGLHALNIQHEYVIQDLYLDKEYVSKILGYNAATSKIYPVWLCPIKATTKSQKLSSHFREREKMLLNVGLYGKPVLRSGIDTTMELEKLILNSTSRKMLYAQTFWTEREFWQKYDCTWYEDLRHKYHATTFRDMYSKIHTPNGMLKSREMSGILQMIGETLRGKNVVWK
jgi:delta24-sterol reductase